MIKKAIIPAAGLGTRLLPATKEQPKEMLPVFAASANSQLCLKPVLQLVFEKLHDSGIREFCFVVGRGKRAVEDHFTPDDAFVRHLENKRRSDSANELSQFYERIRNSSILFVNQAQPKGFGHAVYSARAFAGEEEFLVHAGDDLVLSRNANYLRRLYATFRRHNADAVFFAERTKFPTRYGVIVGEKIGNRVYRVGSIVEKPSSPPSDLAIVGIYIFTPAIFSAIEKTPADENGEIQLTDAIQRLVIQKRRVYALELGKIEKRLDIGAPVSYWDALTRTHRSAKHFLS